MPMKVLSIKYRFCTSVDPVRYDSFDIKGSRSLEAMVVTSTSSGWQSTLDWGRYETSKRRDKVLPTTSNDEGTLFVADDGGSNDESNVDPPREPSPDGVEVGLFSEPEPLLTIFEDVEGGSNEEEEDP
ncbi:hypothetical protein PVK06_044743 [Gossypium arboreum]|uniref:Uncharacterized protein n=1 Tax=Gossypium arboreum TaxID=29729 RepID=A0ABR0MUK3_GOSAR|nr:hypothetical protein PVK06_044743 [Gossypium arboreum]